MISIVHVITGLDTGGAEAALSRIVPRLDRGRFSNAVVSLTDVGARGADLARAGIPVVAIGMRRGVPTPTHVWRLARTIRRFRPSILQTWLPHADLLGTIVGSTLGIPSICWNVRCAELDRSDHPSSLFLILKVLARLSSKPACIVANSVAGREAHIAIGYRPARWELIPNGFDTDVFAPSREVRKAFRARFAIPGDAPLVGLVARFHPMKDHATFIEAASRVARLRPEVHFLMAGKGVDPTNARLMDAVRAKGIAHVTHLVGEIGDPAALFPALDVAVSSSYSEAFPNVIGEAMACAVPCVVTNVGHSAQIVGETGVVVPPRDATALSAGILQVIAEEPPRRALLGEAARARVIAEFSLDAARKRYEDLYLQLATRGGGSTS